MPSREPQDPDCGIAQALSVVGDWWTLLIIRDVAGGLTRFDALQRELAVSRKVLTERLNALVENGVLVKRRYAAHPPRFDYELTERGQALLPVLITLQDWGTRYVMGDGSLSATSASSSAEARRVHALVGHSLPALELLNHDGHAVDPVSAADTTVIYCFPGAYPPGVQGYPPGWDAIPGTRGCTLESTTFRDRLADFADAGANVYGVSTQRPDQLAAFAEHAGLTFGLLSDEDEQLAGRLRLPTFRAAGVSRLKRCTLIVDRNRTITQVLYPITDPAGSVEAALQAITG